MPRPNNQPNEKGPLETAGFFSIGLIDFIRSSIGGGSEVRRGPRVRVDPNVWSSSHMI